MMNNIQVIELKLEELQIKSANIAIVKQSNLKNIASSILSKHNYLCDQEFEDKCTADNIIQNCSECKKELMIYIGSDMSIPVHEIDNKENLIQAKNMQKQVEIGQSQYNLNSIITIEKFQSIPILVRGKSKYEDIVQLYHSILQLVQNNLVERYKSKPSKNKNKSIALPTIIPSIVYSIKELSLLLPNTITITGKSGGIALDSLKYLGLIAYAQGPSTLPWKGSSTTANNYSTNNTNTLNTSMVNTRFKGEYISILIFPELEDYLLDYIRQYAD